MRSPLQNELLKIYKEIKRICEKEKINFFGLGGTALGAVRHQGFIPWDDDIDLGVPANQYEKFARAMKKNLKSPYEYRDLLWMGGKVYNKQTTFIETSCLMNKENCYGVFVDIFPIIGTPNDSSEREKFIERMRFFKNNSLTFDRYREASSHTKKELEKERKELLYQNDLDNSEKIVEFSFGYDFARDKSGIDKPRIVKFEDTTIPLSSLIEEDLTAQYGDYMKLPPKNQRVPHNTFAVVDLEKPFDKLYDELFENVDGRLFELLKQKHYLEGVYFDGSAFETTKNIMLEKELKNREEIINQQKREIELLNEKYQRTFGQKVRRKLNRLLQKTKVR